MVCHHWWRRVSGVGSAVLLGLIAWRGVIHWQSGWLAPTFLALLWLWLRTSAQDYNGVDIPTFNTGSNTKSTASLDYAEGRALMDR